MAHEATSTELTWWQKVLKFEPARIRYIVGGLVLIAGIWGFNFTELGDQISETWEIIFNILVLIFTGEAIRSKVSPTKTVVAQEKPTGQVVAGEAAPIRTGIPVSVVPTTPYQNSGPVVAEDDYFD